MGDSHPGHPRSPRLRRRRLLPQCGHDQEQQEEGCKGQGRRVQEEDLGGPLKWVCSWKSRGKQAVSEAMCQAFTKVTHTGGFVKQIFLPCYPISQSFAVEHGFVYRTHIACLAEFDTKTNAMMIFKAIYIICFVTWTLKWFPARKFYDSHQLHAAHPHYRSSLALHTNQYIIMAPQAGARCTDLINRVGIQV